jgi:hypothetical protein
MTPSPSFGAGPYARESPAGPLVLLHAAAIVLLTWWSWQKWPDPLVDFGRELYLPWQITEGKVLYRDMLSLFGPFSPYVNALWMRVFGVSLATVVAANLVILIATVFGVHRLVRFGTDPVTATVASLSTLVLFGFSQYVPTGNYNFITPYAHETTHGLALSVATLLAVRSNIRGGGRAPAAAAGVCFGALALTKPEACVAAAAAVATGWLGATILRLRSWRHPLSSFGLFAAAASVPPLLFFAFLQQHMEAPVAARALIRPWTHLFRGDVVFNQFYLTSMGLTDTWASVRSVATMSVTVLSFMAASVAVTWRQAGRRHASTLHVAGRLALLAAVPGILWLPVARSLPVVTALALALAIRRLWHRRLDADEAVRTLTLVMWSAFALIMLAKLGLNARISHYGFYLALPAFSMAVVLVCWLLPGEIAAKNPGKSGSDLRTMMVLTLALVSISALSLADQWYRVKNVPVGVRGDRFLASGAAGQWQGAAVHEAVRLLERVSTPADTVAVLPEGVMINYLARRTTPLRVLNVMPPEMMAFGEEEILESLARNPPRLIVLVHKSTSEYGYPFFGTDGKYGLRTLEWITSRYRTTFTIGNRPLRDGGSGVEILERISGPPR